MEKLVYILCGVLIGLAGFFISTLKELSNQKSEIKTLKTEVEEKKDELKTVAEVQKQVRTINDEKKPEKKETPASGDSSSRLDRLNRLHSN